MKEQVKLRLNAIAGEKICDLQALERDSERLEVVKLCCKDRKERKLYSQFLRRNRKLRVITGKQIKAIKDFLYERLPEEEIDKDLRGK